MIGWSKLLRLCHSLRVGNNLTYTEVADILEEVAKHYKWKAKQENEEFEKEIKRSLKEE